MRNVLSAIIIALGIIAMFKAENIVALLLCLFIAYAIWDGDASRVRK